MTRSQNVDSWIYEQDPEIRTICSALRECILDADSSITEYIKFSSPCYKKTVDLFYISANDSYATLGFFNSIPLNTPSDEVNDINQVVSHINMRTLTDVDMAQLKTWIVDALGIDGKI